MNFIETFGIAIRAILLNKARSFLTMLGVIIGVGAVIMLIAIGNGLQAFVTGQFDQLGTNVLFVLPGDIFGEGGGFSQESQRSALTNNKLKYEDVVRLERLRPLVTSVAPLATNQAEVSFQQKSKKTSIVGTTSQYATAQSTPMEKGTFFTNDESDKGEKVAVLGYEIAQDLFGDVDPVGKKIRINSQQYVVKGMAEKQGGGTGGPSFDTYVYIPILNYQKIFDSFTVTQIVVRAKDTDSLPEAKLQVSKSLLQRLKKDEFSIIETTELLSTINQILSVLTLGLGGIAAISLVVGGIGIMNIMLVSVTERTREIGLRKAIGATPNLILLQFLIESALLSVMGGMIGVGIAFLGSLAINAFFPAVVTWQAVALAFGVSVAIGVIFGVAPARRASKLSPIEALRYE